MPSVAKIGKLVLTALFAIGILSCWETFYTIYVINQSSEKIFVIYITGASNEELWRESINAHSRVMEYEFERETWDIYIQFQGGWHIKLYPHELYKAPKDSLDKIEPLKSWFVRNYADIEALNEKFVYP
jgi:hypothetical protein